MTAGRSLSDVGEFGFLNRVLPTFARGAGVVVGVGDDCAVVRGTSQMLATTDVLVEGVHFEPGWQSPAQLGAKAVLVNLSDIAAMGGRPQYCLISVGAPGSCPLRDLEQLHRGARRAAEDAGASIVGGNVSRASRLFVSVALLGAAPRHPALRSGARAGDSIFVTGTLGDAAAGVRVLRSGMRRSRSAAALIRRYVTPTPRLDVARHLVQAGVPSAMIDVSDGLVQDLGHICDSSRVGAILTESEIPCSAPYRTVIGDDSGLALSGGEDYELLFTVPRRRLHLLDKLRSRLSCRLTLVGDVVAPPVRVRLRDREGKLTPPRLGGHDHFRVG